MIILDTHIWIWHVQGDVRLDKRTQEFIKQNETTGLGVSAISIWEIAKAVEHEKLILSMDTLDWLKLACDYPGAQILPLTPEICVESTNLPGTFHRDPADQLIVSTARMLNAELVTADSKILSYPHVKLFT